MARSIRALRVVPTDTESTISAQLDKLKAEGKLDVVPERRCRVCSDDAVRVLVNTLLAHGLSYRDILTVLAPVNRARGKNKITYQSLYAHTYKHFDVSRPAWAVYRAIVDRRANERGFDVVEGVGAAVNYLAYLETMMVKGYANLVDDETSVSTREGMDAALKLAEFERLDASGMRMAQLQAQMNQIISVVKDECSPTQQARIVARLRGDTVTTTDGVADDDISDAEFDVIDDDDDD